MLQVGLERFHSAAVVLLLVAGFSDGVDSAADGVVHTAGLLVWSCLIACGFAWALLVWHGLG